MLDLSEPLVAGGRPGSSDDLPRRLNRLRKSAPFTLVERPSAFNFRVALFPLPGGERSSGWFVLLGWRCEDDWVSLSRARRTLKLFLGALAESPTLDTATDGVGGGSVRSRSGFLCFLVLKRRKRPMPVLSFLGGSTGGVMSAGDTLPGGAWTFSFFNPSAISSSP